MIQVETMEIFIVFRQVLLTNFIDLYIMDFEQININDLLKMEENEPSITQEEIQYLETLKCFNKIENKIDDCYKKLCEIGSQIGNIYTVLNDFNKNILLKP
jgi:hypothetical protein